MKHSRGSSGLCSLPYFLWKNFLLCVLKLALWKVLELLHLPISGAQLCVWPWLEAALGQLPHIVKLPFWGPILRSPGGFKEEEEKKDKEEEGEDL